MIKLNTNTSQLVAVTPREDVLDNFIITDEVTNVSHSYNLSEVVDSYLPNIIQNGTFDSQLNWNAGAAHIDIFANEACFKATGGNKVLIQENVLTVGQRYRITLFANYTDVTSGTFKLNAGSFSNNSTEEREIFDGINTFDMVATSTNFAINEGNAIGNCFFDNISCEPIVPVTNYFYQVMPNYTELNLITDGVFLVEDRYYVLKIYNDAGKVIFYDKAYCTNQTKYTINNNQYKNLNSTHQYKTFKG